MKDLRIAAAAFAAAALIMSFIPMIIDTNVQHKTTEYSSLPAYSGTRGEAGSFRVLRTSAGRVEQIEAEEYICGVVAAEMPASYSDQALMAQAVASFTYACHKRESNIMKTGADLSDSSGRDEAYLSEDEAKAKWGADFQKDWDKISRAVKAVKNKVIVYDGKPIEAFFFSCSGGATESSRNVWGENSAYLVPVPSPWDCHAPDYSSTVKVTAERFKKAAASACQGIKIPSKPEKWLSVAERSPSGTVLTADLCGKKVSGQKIQSLFGLRSADFGVSCGKGGVTFTVRGNGHDVGMSQYGAEYLAKQGKTWEEILQYYYTGITIQDYDWNA